MHLQIHTDRAALSLGGDRWSYSRGRRGLFFVASDRKEAMASTSRQARERRRLERAYSAFRAGELERRPQCEAAPMLDGLELVALGPSFDPSRSAKSPCTGRSVLLHHRRLRSQGGALVSQINTAAVCDPCHAWIHEHPFLAHQAGLIVRQGDAEWDACGVSEA